LNWIIRRNGIKFFGEHFEFVELNKLLVQSSAEYLVYISELAISHCLVTI